MDYVVSLVECIFNGGGRELCPALLSGSSLKFVVVAESMIAFIKLALAFLSTSEFAALLLIGLAGNNQAL